MKLFNKTALALAVSAAAAAPALADDVAFEFTGQKTIVLADVIFGNGMPGTGSEETLITAQSVTLDLDTDANEGDDGANGQTATVKFTLGGNAVFGEDLSTTALVDAANSTNGVFALNATGGNVTYQVVQGGAIGDNTITFELTFGADDVLEDLSLRGYKVKNLTSALNPSSGDKTVELAVEYVEADDTLAGDDIDDRATAPALVIFGSQAPFELTADPNDLDGTAPFVRINVGNAEEQFTGGTGDGRTDFDPTGDVTLVNFGEFQLEPTVAGTFGGVAIGGAVKKENGTDAFDFNFDDEHELEFSIGTGALQVGSTLYVSMDANCSALAADVLGSNVISAPTETENETTAPKVEITGDTDELTDPLYLCYQVATGANAAVIPEAGQISFKWNVDFFNVRYDNISAEAMGYGDLLRNGCIASFFNVPKSTATDKAYIRLTNTSAVNEGDVRGTLYNEDGSLLGDADTIIAPTLPVHATQIFWSGDETVPAASGRERVSIEEAFGITAEDIEGRARLVLKGAFDTCEGLGLIRTGEGSLFNMTATTQGNGPGTAGNNGN